MKYIWILLFSILSVAAMAQPGSLSQSVYKSRVNDTTTVAFQNAIASAVAAGYGYNFWNAQATTPHWDFYTSSGVKHVFDFNAGGGGGGDALTSAPLSQFAATTSAQLRGVLSDEVGTGVAYFVNGALGTPASGTLDNTSTATATTGDSDNTLANTAFVQQEIDARIETFVIPFTDEITPITATTGKRTFHWPYASTTITGIWVGLTTAQTSGSIFTVDVNEAGTTILSTKITVDNTEQHSSTAATPPVISDASIAQWSLITVDVDQQGDNTAKGGKLYIQFTRP